MAKSLKEIDDREFAGLKRAYDAGMLPALVEALLYSLKNDLHPPRWVLAGAVNELVASLTRKKSKRRGRTANILTQYRQDRIHFERYDLVLTVLQRQEECARELGELQKLKNIPAGEIREAREQVRRFGGNLQDAFEFVAEDYGRRGQPVSAETIKKSYKTVRNLAKDPAQAMRFRILSYHVNWLLGTDLPG